MPSNSTQLTRRGLLIAGSTVIIGGSTVVTLGQIFGSDSPLADSYAARTIGKQYVEHYPNPESLWRGAPPDTPEQWSEQVQSLIREDFETNRLVQVDGWWIAETELRLCVQLYVSSA